MNWTGTASELAVETTRLCSELEIDDTVTPNTRLIRHYVQQEVLRRPERRGREVHFGFRQIVEYLAARQLLQDGWPLAKVTEFNRTATTCQLLELLPKGREPTEAQDLVASFKASAPPLNRERRHRRRIRTAPMDRSIEMTKRRVLRRRRTGQPVDGPENIERKRLVRLALADWCHVYVDPNEWRNKSLAELEEMGKIFTKCLIVEHNVSGEER